MSRSTPVVRASVLRYHADGQTHTLRVGTRAWYAWLEQASIFAVVLAEGRFTARKERAGSGRGAWYWRAYRTSGGRPRRAYLGKSATLTLPRLRAIATALDEPADHAATSTPALDARPDPLLATKLHVPRPPAHAVARAPLLRRIDQGWEQALTVVVAPAGFGKTTLLSQAAALSAMPVAWLSLEAADNEPARFLAYLIAALQRAHPAVGRAALALVQSPQPAPMESVLAVLLDDLSTHVVDPLVLVLDDYQTITADAVHRAVVFLVDHLPGTLHLVLASRADPPLSLARWRASGRLTEVRGDDLRFDDAAAATFLREVMGLGLASADVAALVERTEGWIAGLQLAALSMRGHEDLSGFIATLSGGSRYIMDYLVAEVLNQQPEDIQAFLLQTALLDRLSGPLCDALTKRHDGQEMLERLESASLFLVPLDQERRWYRYQHLFADVLRRRLDQLGLPAINELHRRAGQWFAANGVPHEAVRHDLAGKAYDEAARVMEAYGPALIWNCGAMGTVQEWMRALPDEALLRQPRLCVLFAWLRLWTGQFDTVEPLLDVADKAELPEGIKRPTAHGGAEELGNAAQARAALLSETRTIRAELARMRGDLSLALASARAALEVSPVATTARISWGVSRGILAGIQRSAGEVRAASQTYADASASMRALGQIVPALVALGYRVQIVAEMGELRQAAEIYQQAVSLAREYHFEELAPLGVAMIGMADVLLEWNEVEEAERHARAGTALCQQWEGMVDDAVDGYLTLARVQRARADDEAAAATITVAEGLVAQTHLPALARRVAAARARIWLARRRLAPVETWAAALQPVTRTEQAMAREQLDEQLVVARLLLAQGRPAEAQSLLEYLAHLAERSGAAGWLVQMLAVRAAIAQAQGRATEAMRLLADALVLGEPAGYVRSFVGEGAPLLALLRMAAERRVAPAYVGKLLAAFGQPATGTTARQGTALAHLSARELELLRLVAAGLSTGEIAAELVIATGTVRNHLKHLHGKLGAHSRVQAVAQARAFDLL